MIFLRHFFLSRQKPIIKNVINMIFWTFVGFGVYLLLLANEHYWEYPRFQGVISFLSAFFITLPLIVYHCTSLREWYKEHFLYVSEMLIAIPLGLNGLGALYFFNVPWEFDSMIHFFNSFLGAVLIFLIVGSLWKMNTSALRIILFFTAVVGAFVAGIGMEGWENFSDRTFHTHMWGQVGQDPFYDTFFDILYDALGTGVGAILLFFFGEALLARLRRVTPIVQAFAATVKERVHDHVQEKIHAGKKKFETIKIKGLKSIQRIHPGTKSR